MRAHWDEVWRFETARFAIVAEVTDCDHDPEEQFDDDRAIDAIRNGSVMWFDARVRVLLLDTGEELGADYLSGCAYYHPEDLFRHHATLTTELCRLRGKTDRKSQRERKALRECLVNNIKLNPPVSYCEYGPDMVRLAIDDARKNIAKLANLGLRATA